MATALILAATALPLVALAADAPPDPDSACAGESSFRSTEGVTRATLTVINNTDQPVESFWLNYTGTRVFYQRVAAHSRYRQPTWLTHPWIIAGVDGTCYRFLVMTSLEQTVTVNPGTGGTIGTPGPVATATPIAGASAGPAATPTPARTPAPIPTAAPVATAAPLQDPSNASGTGASSDVMLPLLLVAAALVAVGAAVAAWRRSRRTVG